MFGREPALWLEALRQVLFLAVVFGLPLTDVQTGAVLAVGSALLALWTRSRVEPVKPVE